MTMTNNICRLCLSVENTAYDRFLIDIFRRDEGKFSIADALRCICGLEVTQKDSYTKSICSECHTRLHDAYNLRVLSERSQRVLSKLGTTVEIKIEPLNIVDELVLAASDDEFQEQWIELEETVHPSSPEQEHEPVVEGRVDKDEPVDDHHDDIIEFEGDLIEAEITKVEEPSSTQAFLCCGCDISFAIVEDLLKHLATEHRAGRIYDPPMRKVQCSVCLTVLHNKKDLEKHRANRTGGCLLSMCPRCDAWFLTQEECNDHAEACSKPIRCCLCDFEDTSTVKVVAHTLTHEKHYRDQSGRYTCSLCYGRFKTKTELRNHRPDGSDRFSIRVLETSSKHGLYNEKTIHSCCGCFKVYDTLEELNEHRESAHRPQETPMEWPPGAVQCQGCYKIFPNSGQHSHHVRIRLNFFACRKCHAVRKNLQDLRQHVETHNAPKSYLCCGCRMKFDTQEELVQHGQRIHAKNPKTYDIDNPEEKRPFQCQICFRRFTDERNLRNHSRTMYRMRKHMCDVCGRTFNNKRESEIHIATHSTTAEYPCAKCGAKYKHPFTAQACARRHDAPAKQLMCPICNVPFKCRSTYNSHMFVHSDDRSHQCTVCDQAFKRKSILRIHMMSHKGTRNWVCSYCDGRFKTSSCLNKHLIQHTGIYPYQCEICNKTIHTRNSYIKHYESHMHESDKVFKCHLCEFRFSKDHFLSNHIKYKHSIEPQDKEWNAKFNRQTTGVKGKRGRPNLSKPTGDQQNDTEAAEAVEYLEQDESMLADI